MGATTHLKTLPYKAQHRASPFHHSFGLFCREHKNRDEPSDVSFTRQGRFAPFYHCAFVLVHEGSQAQPFLHRPIDLYRAGAPYGVFQGSLSGRKRPCVATCANPVADVALRPQETTDTGRTGVVRDLTGRAEGTGGGPGGVGDFSSRAF